MKRILPLRPVFYIALSVLFIGTLFKLQHWPNATAFTNIGLVLVGAFFLLVLIEILLSKKASTLMKVGWFIIYLALPPVSWMYFKNFALVSLVVLGIVYLIIGRIYFLYTCKDIRSNRFDSI